jgi:hypothetical protein
MKKFSRAKLLFAGAVLAMLGLRATPAEAWCRVPASVGVIFSEEECQSHCLQGGCFSYYFDSIDYICICR